MQRDGFLYGLYVILADDVDPLSGVVQPLASSGMDRLYKSAGLSLTCLVVQCEL